MFALQTLTFPYIFVETKRVFSFEKAATDSLAHRYPPNYNYVRSSKFSKKKRNPNSRHVSNEVFEKLKNFTIIKKLPLSDEKSTKMNYHLSYEQAS